MSTSAPALRVDLGPTVPGWAVRGVAPAVVVLCAALTGGGGVVWATALTAVVLLLWRPGWPTASAVPLLVGAWQVGRADLTAGAAGGVLRLAVLVVAVHLAARLGALAAHATWGARVERAVLGRSVGAVLAVQVLVQGLLLGAVLLGEGALGVLAGGTDVLRLVAVPLVVLLAVLVLPRDWVRRR